MEALAAITLALCAGYADAMEFRGCVNQNDTATCGTNCFIIGNVEFYVHLPHTVALKVTPRDPHEQPIMYGLMNCVIIDERNWSCSHNRENIMARQEMVDGKYDTTNIVDGKMSLSQCAR